MDVTNRTPSEIRGRTSEPGALWVTPTTLDRDPGQSSSIFSGLAGILAIILLVVTVFCIACNWNKRKKRQVPYLQVAARPLTLPRPRQRAKNIYDLLPPWQEEPGRLQSSGGCILSTESLFSRNPDSPEHAPPGAGSVPQVHRARIHAEEFAVGIYDNATVPQMCGNLTPLAQCSNVRASRDRTNISSADSHDYVNVPTAEEIAETLASANSPSRNLLVLPSAQELEFAAERLEDCRNAVNCTSFWSPEPEASDSLSDGECSSQTSNDYVNMTGLDLRAIQETQPHVACQCCRDYENVPPADPSGNLQQVDEEATSSNTGRVEGRTDGPETHIQPVRRGSLASEDYVAFQPSTQSENSQTTHREEMSDEDSDDYENVLAAKPGGRDSEHGPGTQRLPHELKSRYLAGKPHEVVHPVGSFVTAESSEDP
ncbi:lymphocyte transmembrane adapter 1 [Microcebus murinus]|uniref:Lymphocyte transmembrane adaptor 1 n=1 Tax=Microcebus murinus TaxID=30608 RepID=A0A8B7FY08_MICMU|nr:lymphocyte transmembrane adapter 1 [Microcebus murinus]XP_012614312.1 lymphocyte transmembrane adapter 1 [Microcebus murinus]XP_012614322.1 lymphocyte transmembrane adapter 1 [Microcebus murinus]